jgi:DNA-binding NarL/FixJ family response regulator
LLTPAEARVLSLLPTYRTLAAIGTELGIGRPTVKTHVENIYKKIVLKDGVLLLGCDVLHQREAVGRQRAVPGVGSRRRRTPAPPLLDLCWV